MIKHLALSTLMGTILLGSTVAAEKPVPHEQALLNADKFELISLNPSRDAEGGKRFHDVKELGRTSVKDKAVRKKIIEALREGMAKVKGGARCFVPRHGIHIVHNGKTIDFVICFQCSRLYVHKGAGRAQFHAVGKTPKPTFDAILKEAKVELPTR